MNLRSVRGLSNEYSAHVGQFLHITVDGKSDVQFMSNVRLYLFIMSEADWTAMYKGNEPVELRHMARRGFPINASDLPGADERSSARN
jgi:hypothetical protein